MKCIWLWILIIGIYHQFTHGSGNENNSETTTGSLASTAVFFNNENITEEEETTPDLTFDNWTSTVEPLQDENATKKTDLTTKIPGRSSQDSYLIRVYHYWFWVGGIVCTVMSVFGLAGNVLSVIILSTPDMKSSTSVMLILLVVFDSLLLITNILFTNIKWLLHYTTYSTGYSFRFVFPSFPVLYTVSSISHTGTIYSVVALNIERFIVVCHPLKAASVCTISRAIKTSIAVFIFSFVYNIPRFFEATWQWQWVPQYNSTMLLVYFPEFSYSYRYLTVYLVYCNLVVKFLIPVATLLVLNTIMVRRLYRPTNALGKHEKKGTEKERFTAMVLSVFVVFLISTAAAVAELLYYEFDGALSLDECSEICGYVSGISQLTVVFNSSVNFLLFCFFGQKFRSVFGKKFLSCCRR